MLRFDILARDIQEKVRRIDGEDDIRAAFPDGGRPRLSRKHAVASPAPRRPMRELQVADLYS